jgi:hypothetical protein
MKNPTFLLALGSALVLSACGGGGGSSGTSAPAPVQTSTLSTITAANANKAGGNAYAATASISESSSSLTDVLTGVSVGGAGISTVSPVLRLVKRAQGATQLLTGVAISQNCPGGGTVAIDRTVRSQDMFSNGDSVTLTAKNCVEDGVTVDGVLAVTFSNVSGNVLTTFGATMDSRFTNFNIVSGGDKVGVNGDMKIVINQTNETTNSLTISGKSLATTEQQTGAAVVSRTLADYSVTASTLGSTTTSAANFTLSGSSNGLGQFSYTVKNLQPFVNAGTAVPSAGALIVSGAASSVTVTVVGNGVRLDYSAKGDGTITQTNTLSWTEFLASI